MLSKRKLFTATTSLSLCALLVAGTFAWSNFNSSRINTWTGEGTPPSVTGPGGTLHDDHCADEPNKDVYVENWGDDPLFVRIKLSEYMEVGEGAGLKREPDRNNAVSLVNDTSIDDYSTWTAHAANSDDEDPSKPAGDVFHEYWSWTMGGQKNYFPAPESERGRETGGYAYVDSGSPEILHQLDVNVGGDHAKQTLNAVVMAMSQWEAMGEPIGSYWVLDTDGFAYWAAPLLPGEATGLLVDRVESIKEPVGDYYYGIFVDAQMATKDGVAGDNYEVFLQNATPQGASLLNKIVNSPVSKVSIMVDKAIDGDYIYVEPGDEVTLHAFSEDGPNGIVWSNVESEGFRFSANGNEALVRIANDAPKGSEMILTASYGEVSASATLSVMPYSSEVVLAGRTFILNEDNTYSEILEFGNYGYVYSAGPDLIPGNDDDLYNVVQINGVRYLTTDRIGWFRISGPDGKLGTDDDEEEYICIGPPITPTPPITDSPVLTPTPTLPPDATDSPTPTPTLPPDATDSPTPTPTLPP
ncbi:MAG: hypothetical protein LBS84_00885, partial [Clostridiales bacterium]|nr:hypothetical protein [Clostridiales bacterium]